MKILLDANISWKLINRLKTGNNSSQALMELLENIKPMIEDLERNNYGLLEIVKEKK
jgi:hypothetical protein